MKKKLKWILTVLVPAFVLLQFMNPARTNPPVVRDVMASSVPPPEIRVMLRGACYDCHSDETRWPWYSRVAPVSWQIAADVDDGRKQLNLSDWPVDNPLRAAKKLEDMSDEIGYDEMPLKKYELIHAGARLTESQRKELIGWLNSEAARLKTLAKK
ncbi:MAG: heme-binding domain-containing protein [Limisphaerales bacterium]